MLKFMLLSLALSGLHAAPLRDDVVVPLMSANGRRLSLPLSVPVEERRQGTESSRRLLVNLNTGLLQEPISEMDRRVGSEEQQVRSEADVEVLSVPVEERRQGTEPSRRFLVDLNTGLLQEPISEMDRRVGPAPVDVPVQRRAGGWVREGLSLSEADAEVLSVPVEERRQGTEPSRRFLVDLNTGLLQDPISEMDRRVGSEEQQVRSEADVEVLSVPVEERRQGTEPSRRFLVNPNTGLLQDPISEMDRRVGSEEQQVRSEADVEVLSVPVEERRQGTEPSRRFLVNLNTGLLQDPISEMDRRVGSEEQQVRSEADVEVLSVPVEERRQGTEPSRRFLVDPNTGLLQEPISEMDRRIGQASREVQVQLETECVGEVIDGRCYHFNPTPMTFSQAEDSCRALNPLGALASVTNSDLHSRLVSMVTKASNSPVLTWLGGVGKGQRYEWVDGSAWGYSDWMPGHPSTQSDRKTCLEMFRVDESWWTSVDCELKRASICSFPLAA